MNYNLVLGLEIHIHVKTKQKMFCSCDANIYGEGPNTHTCPVCLGLPGALPVPNFDAVQKTQLLGLALGCTLNKNSRFDRKHYFYPDLPKGYQISQYKQPLCEHGTVVLKSGDVIKIERIHLEEDVAKSFHEGDTTLIDFNKSGMPLIEIVTEPVIKSPEAAVEFCKKIHETVKELGISDADMEKGQMRLEANISMRTLEMEKAGKLPDFKVEVKNINSFKFMEKAVKYEMTRQSELLQKNEKVAQENRGWDEDLGQTVSQREKEEAHDYRYFPEPDIPPMEFDEDYFNSLGSILENLKTSAEATKLLNMANHDLQDARKRLINDSKLQIKFDEIYNYTVKNSLNINPLKISKELLTVSESVDIPAATFVQNLLNPQTDVDLVTSSVKKVLATHTDVITSYKAGKVSSLEFLVGQVMKETKGKAQANDVREALIDALK